MTLDYYQQHAADFFQSTVGVDMSALYGPFLDAIPSGGTILDAGCGSGRDAKAFLDRGYSVSAFDGSPEMARMASEYCGITIPALTFDQVTEQARYDGIWCCASLLHLPEEQLPDALSPLARALRSGGIWYLSFKYGEGQREHQGRHFTDLNESRLEQLIAPLHGIHIETIWRTQDKRPDRHEQWLNALLRKA